MASKPQTKKRFNKPSINYHSALQNPKPFDPDSDKFKPKNTSKSENKITTSQLASKLGGIWSFIGQSEGSGSNETLNYGISHKDIESSSFEDLKEMKKQLLFSYRKLVPFPVVKHNYDEYIEAWYKRDIYNYKPKFVTTTQNKFNGHTRKSTENQENRNITISSPNFIEENTQEEGKLNSENKISDESESESKIGFTNSNNISNTPKELSEIPPYSITKTSVSKSSEKDCLTTNENLKEKLFEDQNVISVKSRVQNVICTNRHAIAGAFAGSIVSLCLHPIDTIKTIIQSKSSKGNSFYSVLKCTLTERGFLGLYRGIASNIASSAPISAIYTFTYESVKGTLIPIFPKEYESLSHCISGGCSSIATSFVFTPSERIKQQMQIGTHYQNCWSALIGCVEKGGVTSLYAGWGAVLCRNVPHSIIKFYTYERLKQFILSPDSNSTPSSFQTLACGGLAGSTAALFTTPFDVVKTRIQTQSPGAVTKYNGVFHALKVITKKEGLQGLYRGLTPRLGMYASQGAIFFASYEFLKSIFNLQIQNSASRETRIENQIPMKMHK